MTFVPDWFWLPESKWNALESKQAWKEARMRHIAKIEDPNTKDFIQEYLDTVAHLTGEEENHAFEKLKTSSRGDP